MSGETEDQVSGWTTDTLQAHLQRQIDDLRTMLDERYATQTKAIDAAFVANQTAMQTAFTASERAVQAALDAAEKAVAKAEAAAEKRFEAVNEFRGQLSDQVNTFAPRESVDAQFAAVSARLEDLARARQIAVDEARQLASGLLPREVYDTQILAATREREAILVRIAAMESRLDTMVGQQQGSTARTVDLRATVAAGIGVLLFVITVVVFLANYLTK